MLTTDTASALIHRGLPVVTIAAARTHDARLSLLAAAGHEVKKRQLFRGATLLDASKTTLAGVVALVHDASHLAGPTGTHELPSLNHVLFALARTSVLLFEAMPVPGISELIARLARDCGVARVVGLATQVSQAAVRERLRAIHAPWGESPVLVAPNAHHLHNLGPMLAAELSAHLAPRPVEPGPLLFVPSEINSTRALGWSWRGELHPGPVRSVSLKGAQMLELVSVEPDVAVTFSQTSEFKVLTGGQTAVLRRAGATFEVRHAKELIGELYAFGTHIGRCGLEDDGVLSIDARSPGLVVEWNAPFCVVHKAGFQQPPRVSFGRWS